MYSLATKTQLDKNETNNNVTIQKNGDSEYLLEVITVTVFIYNCIKWKDFLDKNIRKVVFFKMMERVVKYIWSFLLSCPTDGFSLSNFSMKFYVAL